MFTGHWRALGTPRAWGRGSRSGFRPHPWGFAKPTCECENLSAVGPRGESSPEIPRADREHGKAGPGDSGTTPEPESFLWLPGHPTDHCEQAQITPKTAWKAPRGTFFYFFLSFDPQLVVLRLLLAQCSGGCVGCRVSLVRGTGLSHCSVLLAPSGTCPRGGCPGSQEAPLCPAARQPSGSEHTVIVPQIPCSGHGAGPLNCPGDRPQEHLCHRGWSAGARATEAPFPRPLSLVSGPVTPCNAMGIS